MEIHKDMTPLPKQKVKCFIKLINTINASCGSIKSTCKFIGINDDVYRRLVRDGEIKAYAGQKILSAYEKIKGVKNAN